jgi:hypothetical protein
MNTEVERMGKEADVEYGIALPCLCLEEPRKPAKDLYQDSRSWSRDINPESSECKTHVLSTHPEY